MSARFKGQEVFYGWYVAWTLFFASLLSVGLRSGYGVFVSTWQDDFSASVSTVSIAAAVGVLISGLAQPVIGRLTDTNGGRPVIIITMAVMGIGTMIVAIAPNIYVLIGLFGFLISAASGGVDISTATTIVRWFQRKRGTAISLLTAGGSAGGLLLVPFAAYLLILTDWRITWLVLGVVILFVGVPLVAFVVRSDPADMALNPDGDPSTPGATSNQVLTQRCGPLEAVRWRDALRSPPIWQLSTAYVICGITTASIAVHFVRWAESESISPGTAATAFGVLMGINGLSVLTIGMLSDRMPRRVLLGAIYLVRGIGFLSLVFVSGEAALWGFAIIGGVSWVATVPLTNALTADVYGLRHLGTLVGFINMMHQLGGAAAVYVFGLVFDRYGTYDPAYLCGAALLLLAAVIALSIKERRFSSRYLTAPDIADSQLNS